MPPGDRMVAAMKKAAKMTNPSTNNTDVVYGVVQKIKPLTVLIDNRLELTEEFLVLSPFCYSTSFSLSIPSHAHNVNVGAISVGGHTHKVDDKETTSAGSFTSTPSASCEKAGSHKITVTLWDDLKVGDKLVMLRISQGQGYMILYRDRLSIKATVE